MAFAGIDSYLAAPAQRIPFYRTTTRTTVAGGWFSLFDVAGDPGAGTLAIGNTANGVVPTDATAGYPIINAFGGSNRGYLGRLSWSNTVIGRIKLYDRLFAAGAYAFNANTTLASIPSYSARVSLDGGAANYNGLELWVEMVTAATGNQAVNVTYTDQSGNTGNTTGAVGIGAAPTVGRCWQLPLAAGDSGIQAVNVVVGSVASAGTFNVMVLRPIGSVYIAVASAEEIHDLLKSGTPEVFADSAIYALYMAPSGTSSGVPNCELEVFNA